MRNIILAAGVLAASMLGSHAFAQATIHTGSAVEAGTYTIEPGHTRVLWSTGHMGFTTWYGEFTKTAGTLTLNPTQPAASALAIMIQTGSVSTTNTRLDGELVGPEWFDAAPYPTITFVSTSVQETGPNTANVTGNLTFHGVTKPVTLAVSFNGAGTNPMSKRYTAGFEVSGDLKRADFGVKTDEPMIGDDVKLMISAAFEHQ